MTKKNRLKILDKKYVWHPFTQMMEWDIDDQLIIEKGNGNYLIDSNGRKYIDGVSSLWVNVHGHRKQEIDNAIKAQLNKIAHTTLLGLGNIPSIELAEKLVKIVPKGLTRVFYSDNGSTAVEISLKMVFQYWQQKKLTVHNSRFTKNKFISFTGAYHGDTIGSMSVGEIDVFVRKYKPLLFQSFKAFYPYCYRCPIGETYPGCKLSCIQKFEDILKKNNREICACIIEPIVQGAAGIIVSPPGFLKEVRRLCTKHNILLIADEVATGFGRTGKMFACEHENVIPDLICLSKGLTGGYMPLAATITTEKIYKAFLGEYEDFKAFFHGHTYTGNPLGCAAALANISVFEKEKTLEKLESKTILFGSLLERLKDMSFVGDVRYKGLMAGIEIVKDKKTKQSFPPKLRIGFKICMEARKYGLIIRPIGDTIIIVLPLSITMEEIRKVVRIVSKCIQDVKYSR